MEYFTVYITTQDKEAALRLGEALVRERLAACANILEGVNSVYWWQGALERSTEAACLLKTNRDNLEALIRRARELHAYETPCVTAWPISSGNPDFFTWIDAECRRG